MQMCNYCPKPAVVTSGGDLMRETPTTAACADHVERVL